jgi:sugar phosphate isomerase/epimerase
LTLDEMLALLKEYSSEFLGVCLDTGNNVALLDDPMAVVEGLAPYAVTTHLKDMAVEPYADGFLLSEVALGEGMFDLKQMVATVAKARPATRFSLEMITRNPLQVPCLTDGYWATFPDRNGLYLARTLTLLHKVAARLEPLPRVDDLNPAARLRLEEEYVKQSLNYGRVKLGL